jgi:hypothetical protein
MQTPTTHTLTGGCHCGAVRYRIQLDRLAAIDCNCTMCTKKGFIHAIVPPDRFELLQGRDALSLYQFNTGVAQHLFCQHCGIHSFYRPRSHPDSYDVNVRCLDDVAIEQFELTLFDGQHWEANVDKIRRDQPVR